MGTRLWHIAVFVAILLAVAAIVHPTNFRQAWMYLSSGKLHDAVVKLNKIYKKNPDDYRTIKMLATALEEEGNVDQAERLYAELIKIKPRDDNFKEVVRFYIWTLQPGKAQQACREWLDFRLKNGISLDDEDGKQMLSDLYAYDLLYEDYKEGIKVLYLLRDVEPKEAGWINDDLISLYEMSGDFDSTVSFLENILKQDPKNIYALEKFLQLAKTSGKIDIAKGYLEKDIRENPSDAKVWNRLIDFDARTGDLNAANGWYVKWLDLAPNDWARKKRYINWLMATDQQKTAIAYLEGLDASRLSDPWFMKTLIDLYEWNNDKKKLAPIYEARFERNPGDRANAEKLIWLLNDLKEYAREERVLKRLVEFSPGNREYETMLMNFYEGRNDSAAALPLLKKLATSTNDPALLKRLGEYYMWNAGKKPAQ